MTNNDILRRLRFVFDFNDSRMIKLFELAEFKTTREQISNWLKKEDDPAYKEISDTELAMFLNGLIAFKRGQQAGKKPPVEKRLNNNIILRKLKIALELKDEDILEILTLADFRLSKPELSAFFRKPDHKHFRKCKDQVVRRFLTGLQLKLRPETSAKTTPDKLADTPQAKGFKWRKYKSDE